MYCDLPASKSLLSARFTVFLVGRSLIDTIAVVLPHLAVEFYSNHPILKHEPSVALKRSFDEVLLDLQSAQDAHFTLNETELDEITKAVERIRSILGQQIEASHGEIVILKKVGWKFFSPQIVE